MSVCPMYCTGQSNGIYYYYCLSCPGSTPVGGQDTRMHQCGVDCNNILDQIQYARPKEDRLALMPHSHKANTSSPLPLDNVIDPVYSGPLIRGEGIGLNDYITIHEPFFPTAYFICIREKKNPLVVTYQETNGGPRIARLFTIEIHWPPQILPFKPRDVMLVGQEMDPTFFDNGANPTIQPVQGKHIKDGIQSDYQHHVVISDETYKDRHFYIFLKNKAVAADTKPEKAAEAKK